MTTLALVGTVAVVGAVQAGAQEAARQSETRNVTVKVDGMRCSVCAKTIARNLERVDGVTAAAVSQPKGTAEVTYDPAATTPEAIRQAIRRLGFRAELPAAGKR